MSEDTDILKAKQPVLWAALSFLARRAEAMVIAAAIAGVTAYLNWHHEEADKAWIGEHLQEKQAQIDNIKTNEQGSMGQLNH